MSFNTTQIHISISTTDRLIDITNLGDINTHLSEYERGLGNGGEQPMTLTNSMLVFMAKGLFNSFHFPYSQFPCTAVTGSQLYPVLWEAICLLETMGFRGDLVDL